VVDERLPRVGDVLGGKYRVERLIARGGMGAVFVAVHEVTGGRVALKWLLADDHDVEASHRLIREARAAARVRHPNVVAVYDIGEHAGSLFLVMELLDGETLAALLKRKGRLDVQETLEILLPTLRAVHAAHRSHVIHRDLKPSNVFLCADEAGHGRVPRVLDFGISKLVATPEDPEYSLTQTGAVIGTPYYMAPEQLAGRDIDHRIDIYALGVMLYQALGGRLPFDDTNYNALVVMIATTVPVPLSTLRPDLPRALCAVVEKAMARQRDDRYASTTELMEALQLATQPANPPSATAPSKSSRAPLGIALTLGLASAVALAWWLLDARSVPTVAVEPEPARVRAEAAPTAAPSPAPSVPEPPTAAAPVPEPTEPPKARTPRKRKRVTEAAAVAPTPTADPAAPVSISADQF
jgi:eukaryotic-like serine/threonine-protein kinase